MSCVKNSQYNRLKKKEEIMAKSKKKRCDYQLKLKIFLTLSIELNTFSIIDDPIYSSAFKPSAVPL